MTDKTNQERFYDEFSTRQLMAGINARHKSIIRNIKRLNFPKGSSVLEIGSGIGTLSELLLKYLKPRLLCLSDLSMVNINHAKNRLKNFSQVEYYAGDFCQVNIPGKYDLIVLPDVIEHIPIEQHQDVFHRITALLDNDGTVFINIPQPFLQQWHLKFKPELLQIIDQAIFSGDLIKAAESAGLYLHEMKTYSIWVKECDYQYFVFKKKPDITLASFNYVQERNNVCSRTRNKLKHWGGNK